MISLLLLAFAVFPYSSLPLAQSAAGSPEPADVQLTEDCAADESCEGRTGSWLIVPVLGVSPETDFTFGVGYLHSFFLGSPADTSLSASRLALQYSLKSQLEVRWLPRLYFPGDLVRLRVEVGFSDFPNSYWGLGPETSDSAEETYTTRSWRGRVDVERRVGDDLYVGGIFEIESFDVVRHEEGGLLGAAPGSDGGLVAGMGLSFSRDRRDNRWATHRGQRQTVTATSFGAWMGSDFDFTRLELESLHFAELGRRHILAGQVRTELNFGSPPFERLALLGGDSIMRGYFEGRYRDNHQVAAQLEYRTPFLWRFGLVAFVAAGWVFGDLDDLGLDHTKLAGGLGLRFAFDPEERIHIRIDYGQALDSQGFYIGLGEAF